MSSQKPPAPCGRATLRGLLALLEGQQARVYTSPTGTVAVSIQAIRAYLDGKVATLDAAFQVNGQRGYPEGRPRNPDLLAKMPEVHRLREQQDPPASWKAIADRLEILDVDSLRYAYRRYLDDLMAQELKALLASEGVNKTAELSPKPATGSDE